MTGSLLDRLRAEAAQAASAAHVDLPIAGYRDPELFARYRFVDIDETKEIGKRVRAQWESDDDRLLYGGIAVMVEACQGIYTRENGAQLEPLDLGDSGGPVTFEPRLADALGVAHASAADIVKGIFKGNSYAVVEHATLLQRWMSDTTKNVVGSLGER